MPLSEILADAAERVALWNEFRVDDFPRNVVRTVNAAREHWRDESGELPPQGIDPMLDALLAIADVADESPITVRDACAAAFRAAEDRVAR